jgi:predicted RNase H-like nuclease (RuvC/YqgF family)
MEQDARQRAGETQALASRLQAAQQRVRELELTVCAVSTQNRQLDRCNKELRKQQAALQQQLDYMEEHNEDLIQ